MLELAYKHAEALNEKYLETINEDRYKYMSYGLYAEYELKIFKNDWDKIQYVSIVGDDIKGYFSANVDRINNKIDSLLVINFSNKTKFVFSRDLCKFFDDIFIKKNFRKIVFSTVVDNQAENMYDKFVMKYDGRIVGVFYNNLLLRDGKEYNEKFYEITKEKYLDARIKLAYDHIKYSNKFKRRIK